MLHDIELEAHNLPTLLKKSGSLGVISDLVDIYRSRTNTILIVSIFMKYDLKYNLSMKTNSEWFR